MREDFQAARQNAVQLRDECAVVRHGNALILGAFHAIKHFTRVEHAAAAMNDEAVLLQIFGKGLTA